MLEDVRLVDGLELAICVEQAENIEHNQPGGGNLHPGH